MPPLVSPSPSPYDDFASVYDVHWSRRVAKDFNRVLKRLLLPSLAPENHVLDVCCGTGRTAQYLLKHNLRVTGIDASEAMLELAPSHTQSCTRRRLYTFENRKRRAASPRG
ncbi:MAG: methyltransferase domain-containing protein [Pyrinomonadaceae bacterium MAG19_C2-C3]|nr:methyltransferase domain-containing protein [Pyrinomonadaceae bacterium MAG19_C2-C3]